MAALFLDLVGAGFSAEFLERQPDRLIYTWHALVTERARVAGDQRAENEQALLARLGRR